MKKDSPFEFEDLIECFETYLDESPKNGEPKQNQLEDFLTWAKKNELFGASQEKTYEGRKWFTGSGVIR